MLIQFIKLAMIRVIQQMRRHPWCTNLSTIKKKTCFIIYIILYSLKEFLDVHTMVTFILYKY